jgi:preprotein translocase SecE subunit
MTTDNQRILQYSMYVLGLILAFLIYETLNGTIELIDTFVFAIRAYPIPLVGSLEKITPLIGLGAGIAAAEYARRHPVANKYGIEVIGELRKVTWPDWKEIKGTTLVVFGVSFVVTVILFTLDTIFEGLMNLLVKAVS